MTAERVRELNDELRRNILDISRALTGNVVITEGIAKLPENEFMRVMLAVRDFDDFIMNDDPFGEHEFGVVRVLYDRNVFFKIDYYNKSLNGHSPNKSDPEVTKRVLTVMLSTEY